jgi:hypothetical protein
MVLAMDGDPFLGDHAGAQPQPEAEEVRWDRTQFHGPMRLRAVQEDRYRGNRDVSGHERVEDDLPPREIPHAVSEPVDSRVQHGRVRKEH